MGWSDYYRRRDILDEVLEQARRDPAGGLPFAEVPGAAEVFGGPAELLAALHHKWMLALSGRIEAALAEAPGDPVAAVAAAWRASAARHGVLRRLLDAHAGEYATQLRPAVEGERRLLALTAGLAGAGEPVAEISRVGAAFLALLRSNPETFEPDPRGPAPTGRSGRARPRPRCALRRRLAASA